MVLCPFDTSHRRPHTGTVSERARSVSIHCPSDLRNSVRVVLEGACVVGAIEVPVVTGRRRTIICTLKLETRKAVRASRCIEPPEPQSGLCMRTSVLMELVTRDEKRLATVKAAKNIKGVRIKNRVRDRQNCHHLDRSCFRQLNETPANFQAATSEEPEFLRIACC
jgi:hypothetical protein